MAQVLVLGAGMCGLTTALLPNEHQSEKATTAPTNTADRTPSRHYSDQPAPRPTHLS